MEGRRSLQRGKTNCIVLVIYTNCKLCGLVGPSGQEVQGDFKEVGQLGRGQQVRDGAALLIPAVGGIGNSDLPGLVTAQVVEDVYDSVTGNYLLVPKGARLIGQYGSSPRLGQERLMLAFNRVIFPDGATLTLGAMPGASQDGFSGFEADVDNHLFRLITQAVLLGGISASVTISQDDDEGNDDSHDVGSAFSEALGMSLGTALTRVIENNMNISPTLTVDPGYSFNVVVAKDLRFKGPYRDVFR